MGACSDGYRQSRPLFPRLCRYPSERAPQTTVAAEGLTHGVNDVNPAFARFDERQRQDLIGCPFVDAVPEGAGNGCRARRDRVFRTVGVTDFGMPEPSGYGAARGIRAATACVELFLVALTGCWSDDDRPQTRQTACGSNRRH